MGLIRELHCQSALGFFKEMPDFLGCKSFLSSQIGKSFILPDKIVLRYRSSVLSPASAYLLHLGDQCLFLDGIRSGLFYPVFSMQLFSRFPGGIIGDLLIWMGKIRSGSLVHPFTGLLNIWVFEPLLGRWSRVGKRVWTLVPGLLFNVGKLIATNRWLYLSSSTPSASRSFISGPGYQLFIGKIT